MRTVLGIGSAFSLTGSCQPPSTSLPVLYAVEITGESIPILCADTPRVEVVQLFVKRDPLTDQPEWLSGHRHALGFFLEQMPVWIVVLEVPWEDTAFFRAGHSVWGKLFERWLTEDFLPFLRAYPQVELIILGRGWHQAPLSAGEWQTLLLRLRAEAPERRWGFSAGQPDRIPAPAAWDVLAIDYQHFYPPEGRAAYHKRWESLNKPLLLLYPNLYEPDKVEALLERQRYWEQPPRAIVLSAKVCS